MVTAILAYLLICLVVGFPIAWAVCFFAGVFGYTLVFSWKLALACGIVIFLIKFIKETEQLRGAGNRTFLTRRRRLQRREFSIISYRWVFVKRFFQKFCTEIFPKICVFCTIVIPLISCYNLYIK